MSIRGMILTVSGPLVAFSAAAQTNNPPRLGSPELLTNNVVQFRIFDGSGGQTNVIEASTNLVDWTTISPNLFPPSLCPICPFIVFDDSMTNSPRRFYRARNLPQ